MQYDRVGRSEHAPIFQAAGEKIHFRQVFATPVKPQIKPVPVSAPRLVRLGDNQSVRLHRSVDFRNIPADDEPRLGRPGRLTGCQLPDPLKPLPEQIASECRLFVGQELAIIERIANRPMKDLHIG